MCKKGSRFGQFKVTYFSDSFICNKAVSLLAFLVNHYPCVRTDGEEGEALTVVLLEAIQRLALPVFVRNWYQQGY